MIARLALLLVTAGLGAQGADKTGVRIRFQALAFDEPILGASYLEGDDLRRIDIPNNAFTREISYQGANTLRFITIDEETLKPKPLSPEMSAATQRLRRAQALTLQASDEQAQITRLLDTLNLQASEKGGKASEGDQARIAALNERLRELSGILAAAAKETEETNLHILRLESAPTAPPDPARKRPSAGPRPTSTPTAEYSFQKDGRYLLLFSSAGNGHQILAMDDVEGAFPYGSYQFINLTGKELELRYPGSKRTLKPNARTVVKNPVPDHRYAATEIFTKTDDGHELGLIYRALQQPDVRTLIFLLPVPDEPIALRSKSIEDRRPAEAGGRK